MLGCYYNVVPACRAGTNASTIYLCLDENNKPAWHLSFHSNAVYVGSSVIIMLHKM